MAGENGSTDPMVVTNPENDGASATDVKGKGKAPAADNVEDTSMAEDDDDDDDADLDEVSAGGRAVATRSIRFTTDPDH